MKSLPQLVTALFFQVFNVSPGGRGGGDPAPFTKVVALEMPCRRSPPPGADAEGETLRTLKMAVPGRGVGRIFENFENGGPVMFA